MADMRFSDHAVLTWLIWAATLTGCGVAALQQNWALAFVALATFVLSVLPVLAARYAGLVVPRSFMAAIVFFIYCTLYLGEVLDFYNRFWWWDVLLHGGSAVGFGLMGFVAVFMMFQGNRFAAPHLAVAFFGMCFAMAMGTMWEILEFAADSLFGLNMQKSGLRDTMGDLCLDLIGAFFGSTAGYLYLKGRDKGGLSGLIAEFVTRNPRFFGQANPRKPTDRQ
jgi:hypothetical protein